MAMSAGMDMSSGDAVIFMDADLQHPPHIIKEMLQIWEGGKKIVLTKRSDNEDKTIIYKILSAIYYKALNYLSEFNMQTNTPDFRLIDRYYVDILKRFRENSRLFRGILYLIDASEDTETIDFTAPKRFSGQSKYDFWILLNLAIDSVIAFSIKPLRIALNFNNNIYSICNLWFIYPNKLVNGANDSSRPYYNLSFDNYLRVRQSFGTKRYRRIHRKNTHRI